MENQILRWKLLPKRWTVFTKKKLMSPICKALSAVKSLTTRSISSMALYASLLIKTMLVNIRSIPTWVTKIKCLLVMITSYSEECLYVTRRRFTGGCCIRVTRQKFTWIARSQRTRRQQWWELPTKQSFLFLSPKLYSVLWLPSLALTGKQKTLITPLT